tara:strand:+ start:493 stop:1104 length:612 start_codon:yes stop_codon:yes gene_type:complete
MSEETPLTEKTHLRCKIIIEVLGKPKEHVEKSIQMYVDAINKDSDLIILKKEFADAKEKEKLWATFVELEMVIKGLPKLIAFCFDYMPSSIEILKPEELIMTRSTIADFANDLQSRLHDVDMIIKKLKNESDFLKKNMNTVINNTILISLLPRPLDKEGISKITGIKDKELQIFLDSLIKEDKLAENNGVYALVQEKIKNAEK